MNSVVTAVDGDIAIAHPRTNPTLPHEAQLVPPPRVRMRDDRAPRASSPVSTENRPPVRSDRMTHRTAVPAMLSLSKAHHL